MSLLDQGNADVLLYPEEDYTDSDGNQLTRPAKVGIPARVSIQPQAQSGTSSRRSEQDNEGFETEQVYRMRLLRKNPIVLGPQSRIEWEGKYWAVIGFPIRYNGSRRTRRNEYTIRRS